jgi:hypothetical protein
MQTQRATKTKAQTINPDHQESEVGTEHQRYVFQELVARRRYRVIEAMGPYAFSVTPAHVREGHPFASHMCPIARAIRDDLGHFSATPSVLAERSLVYVVDHNRREVTKYATPAKLKAEIDAFDRGQKMTPGTYTLQAIPTSWTREATEKYDNGRRRLLQQAAKVRANQYRGTAPTSTIVAPREIRRRSDLGNHAAPSSVSPRLPKAVQEALARPATKRKTPKGVRRFVRHAVN